MQRSKGLSMAPAGIARIERWRYSLVGIVLLGLTLRLVRLNFQPLWWDEGWSLFFATTGVGNMLRLTAVDIHPPLYYLLLHGWIGVFGSSAISVRILSVLIGTAAIPLLYAIGKRLFGRPAGLLAAFLLAVSPFHIYYSQEVRMYGLVTLFGVAALYFALRWMSAARQSRPQELGSLAGYVLASAGALYTQYYAAFLLLAVNLFVVILSRKPRSAEGGATEDLLRDEGPAPKRAVTVFGGERGSLWAWLGAQVAVLLLYLPWLWYAGPKLVSYVRFKVGVEQYPSMGLLTYLGRHLTAFDWGHAEGFLVAWWWLGLLPLFAVVLLLALYLWPRFRSGDFNLHPNSRVWPWLVPVVLLACGFAVNLVFPFNPEHGERLLLLALPAYLLSISATLLVVSRQLRRATLLVMGCFLAFAMVSLASFYAVPRYPDDDYRPVASRLQALALPSDAIICVHPWQVGYFEAYLPAFRRPALILTPRQVLPQEQQLWADDPARMAADLDALLADHSRLWLPAHQAMGRILESQIEGYLTDQSYPVLSEWYGKDTVLSLFASARPQNRQVAARFGAWLELRGATLSAGPVQAGWGIVAVNLNWEISERPADSYTISLRLVGPTGDAWAQRDAAPLGGLAPFSTWPVGQPQIDHHGLLVPAGTPPGDYHVVLQVYRSDDIAVLPAAFEGGSGGEVALGTIRVARPDQPPPLEALTFQREQRATFGGRLRLLGSTVNSTSPLRPGEPIPVELGWQALVDPGEDFLPTLQLVDAEGNVWAKWSEKPVAGTYPTAWWRADELVRDRHALPIPATVPAGRYNLALSLIRAVDNQPVETRGEQTPIALGEVEVEGRQHFFEPVSLEHSQAARFDDSISLTGYDISEDTLSPGASLDITLTWRAMATPGVNLKSFVHLLDAGDTIVAQHDSIPGNGTLPTMGWLPGEYLSDPHLIQLPLDLPGGSYRLGVGLFDPITGIRLGDRVILDTMLNVTAER